MNQINKRITKRFARFLKEHGVYMYYVRNLLDSLNNDSYQPRRNYKRFLTTGNERNALFSAFTWATAHYPLNMTAAEKHDFWSNLDSQWVEYLDTLEN